MGKTVARTLVSDLVMLKSTSSAQVARRAQNNCPSYTMTRREVSDVYHAATPPPLRSHTCVPHTPVASTHPYPASPDVLRKLCDTCRTSACRCLHIPALPSVASQHLHEGDCRARKSAAHFPRLLDATSQGRIAAGARCFQRVGYQPPQHAAT